MEIETKVDLLTMLTFAELKSRVEVKIDKLMKVCEYLTLRDIFEEVCTSNSEKYKFFKDEIKKALAKYEFYKGTWYLKPLNGYKCKYCGKKFKHKSKGLMFCCDDCKTRYYDKIDGDII